MKKREKKNSPVTCTQKRSSSLSLENPAKAARFQDLESTDRTEIGHWIFGEHKATIAYKGPPLPQSESLSLIL